MKKGFVFCSIILLFACCKDDHVMTKFYVKNTSNKTIRFDASVIKFSQITDPYEVSLPFTVYANDSVLARETRFSRDGKNPQRWFNTFVIHSVDGIEMNDPNLPKNWIKYNTNDNPILCIYTK